MTETVSQPWNFATWLQTHARQMDTWTADQMRAKFAEFEANEPAMRADLQTRKADALRNLALNLGFAHARGSKKAELLDEICDHMARQYVPGILTYRAWTVGSGETPQTMREAVRERLAKLTDAELQEHRQKDAQAAALLEKGLTNPETFEEFRTFLAHRNRAELTLDQAERWDELQVAQQRKTPTPEPVIPTGAYRIKVEEGWHARDQRKTFVAVLVDRVPDAAFAQLRNLAKGLGGYYSSFRGSGAIPGFQFKTPELANAFHAQAAGQSSQVSDDESPVQGSGATRLLEQAQRIEDAANDELTKDRLTNTARRADMAANIEARARARLALAQSMRCLAEALQQDRLVHLRQIRHGSQLEELESLLRQARWNRRRNQKEDLEDRPFEKADIPFADFPRPMLHKSTLKQVIHALSQKPGCKRLCAHIAKLLEESPAEEWGLRLNTHEACSHVHDLAMLAKGEGIEVGDVVRNLAPYRRLMAADIQSPAQLRCALREYLRLRSAAAAEDPVRQAERELIGVDLPGFFPTPPSVIQLLLDHASVSEGDRVLEPSAGKGDILDALAANCRGAVVHAIEINSTLRCILDLKGHEVVAHDFLEYPTQEIYDRILMNPPFEKGQDIDHVRKAFQHLGAGGRLVAVVSNGPFFRSDRKSTEFRAWLDEVHAQVEDLPEGSFQTRDTFRQTGVSTRLIIIEKPLNHLPASTPATSPQTMHPATDTAAANAGPAAGPAAVA